MSKTNILQSFIHPKPATSELETAMAALGIAFERTVKDMLERLHRAEEEGFEMLRNWTPTENLLTLKQAATYLQLHPKTLDRWTRGGKQTKVPYLLIEGEKRFKLAQLDKWLDGKAQNPTKVVL